METADTFEHFVRLHVEYDRMTPTSHLLRGTAADLGEHIASIVTTGLKNGNITRIEANPIAPYNVWPVGSTP